MCGISCILSLQHSHHHLRDCGTLPNGLEGIELNEDADYNKLAKEVDESLDMIKHRGPDARGQWISGDKRVGPLTFLTCSLESTAPVC